MLGNNDVIQLYSSRILELAGCIPLTERLKSCDASVKVRSPLCGSTVTVDLVVKNGVITKYGQDVKACALGQAAASVVAAKIIGRTRPEIELAKQQLQNMLESDGVPPTPPFDELAVLEPARNYKNRHASIQLVLNAISQAMASLEPKIVA